MAGTGLSILRRIRAILGDAAALDTDIAGVPRVAPHREDGVALVLHAAARDGWRVRIEGMGGWMPADAPADLALSTRHLTQVSYLDPADLVATAQAGIGWSALRRVLADRGAWIAADPPGQERTLGSVIATGTAGALRGGFGGIRDQLLGVTLVTGDGRVVRAGGRVVKNVAGFDLTKLAAGSYGAFGVVTSATLRLRAVPRADVTLVGSAARDALLQAGRAVLEAGLTPAALELVPSGTDRWILAARLTGAPAAVRAERDRAAGAAAIPWQELSPEEASDFWDGVSEAAASGPITVRLAALPTALEAALDLAAHHLPDGWLAVTVAAGAARWSGDVGSERLRLLRHAAAQREMPLTVERAPWALRAELGHFGAYREGVGRLVGTLRRTFDPEGVLVAAVGEGE